MNDQSKPTDLAQRAREILHREVGTYTCRWEFLDDDGQVISTAEGQQTMEFVLNDSVVLIRIDAPELNISSVSHRFFHPATEKIYRTSVDSNGDFWTFLEDLETDTAQSLPHLEEDGTTSHLRFRPLKKDGAETDVLMEMSHDLSTWKAIFRMKMIKQ